MMPLTGFIKAFLLVFLAGAAQAQATIPITGTGSRANNVPVLTTNTCFPVSMAMDSTGNSYIAAPKQNRVFKIDAATGAMAIIAGNGTPGFSGDGKAAKAATLNGPESVAVDGRGNLYIVDTNNQRIRKVDVSGIITTVAGNGIATFGGDGGAAILASLNYPLSMRVNGDYLYIADTSNHRIRKIDVTTTTGFISTVAGNGIAGFSGDGGAATAPGISGGRLNYPHDVTVNAIGDLFIADTYNQRIRRVDSATGIISTVAGNGLSGFDGDGRPATGARLNYPNAVDVDALGNIYIADTSNNRIRKVDTVTGLISTVAGNGTAAFGGDGSAATGASLNIPTGVAVDGANLYIADANNNRIRMVDTAGIIGTPSGNRATGSSGDGLTAAGANLLAPQNVAVDSSGNFYIADTYNHRIRKMDTSGAISTVAGNGTAGSGGDGGTAISASLNTPNSVAVDNAGNLYIADTNNNCIRMVDTAGIISTVAGNGASGFGGDGATATRASLRNPIGVAVDGADNLYIADTSNNRIRKVDALTGNIGTVAGNGTAAFAGDGAAATLASLRAPYGVAVDDAGNLYIADTSNNRIRKVNALTGNISTVAGNGTAAFAVDGVTATQAGLTPYSVTVDAEGNLYIADGPDQHIRMVDAVTRVIRTVSGSGIFGFSGSSRHAAAAALVYPTGSFDSNGNLYSSNRDNNRIRRDTGRFGVSPAFPPPIIAPDPTAQMPTMPTRGAM